MEEASLRFGDQISADFKLWLTGPNEKKYERNPVFLHSVILKRSNFFKIVLSERWSSGKLTEVSVTTPHSFDDYLKCIQLMYSQRVYFLNVEECLNILSVASDLLADDSINKCMQYLEAVPWSGEQESHVRNVLSSLGLKVLPDLAARLERECVCTIVCMQSVIKQMVSILQGNKGTNKENAENYIASIFEKNTHPDIVKVCAFELLQCFISSIRSHNFLGIMSLSKWVERCDGEIVEEAFKAFCEDQEFIKRAQDRQHGKDVFSTIMLFMKAMGNGKIIISRVSRSSFITNWLPIVAQWLRYERGNGLDELEKAILIVLESLSNADKIGICNSWIEIYKGYNMDISTPLSVVKVLQDAHCKSTSKE